MGPYRTVKEMAKPSSATATPQRTSTDATSSRTSSRPEWFAAV